MKVATKNASIIVLTVVLLGTAVFLLLSRTREDLFRPSPDHEPRLAEKGKTPITSAYPRGFPPGESGYPAGEDQGGEVWARSGGAGRSQADYQYSPYALIVVEGVVLSSYDRSPVTDARVSFSTLSSDFAAVRTTVSREGIFRVRLPRAEGYIVRAEAEGFRDYTNSRFSVLTQHHARTEILMHPIHILRGQVLDTQNRPVSNALVRMVYEDELWSQTLRGNNTRTANSGEFEIELPAGRWLVSASHEWFLSLDSVTVSLPEEDYVTLYMGRPAEDALFGRIFGRVVDSEEAAVLHASVSLRDQATRASVGGTWTDPGGRFSFDRVRPGHYLLTPAARGYALSRDDREVHVEANGEYSVELVLTKSVAVEGVVLSHTGNPIEEAIVLIEPDQGPKMRLGARTGADGKFRYPAVEPGQYQVEARHQHYRTARGELSVPEQDWLTLVLEDGLTFEGTLNTNRGSPVEQFVLSFLDPSTRRPLKSVQFTSVDGRFLVRGLEPGIYRLEVTARNEEPVGMMLELWQSLEALLVIDPSSHPPLRMFPAGR